MGFSVYYISVWLKSGSQAVVSARLSSVRLWYMLCSCFVVFSVKSLIIGRQSGPGEILRCDCGWLAPRSLATAALYHICSVSTNSGFACQRVIAT